MSSANRKSVSMRQLELLIEYLEGHRDLALGRMKSREGRALSLRLWSECAEILNSEADGHQRTAKQWNKWFTDYKCRLMTRIRNIKKNQQGTGGGPGVPADNLTALEERLAAVLGAHQEVVGRSGTPQIAVQINPVSPELIACPSISPLPAHAITLSPVEMSFDEQLDVELDERNKDSSPPTQVCNEGEQEVTPAIQGNRRRKRRRVNTQTVSQSSELEQSQNVLASLERSRIEVERLMATAYNKMADATLNMAEAVKQSADASCRIAVALENINLTLQNLNARGKETSEDV